MIKHMTGRFLVAGAALLALNACASGSGAPDIDWNGDQRTALVPVQSGDSYYVSAQAAVDMRIKARSPGKAKNVILFVGDGMGVSTVTGARILAGQVKGVDGESYRLAMEKMPWTGLSKTYSHDAQISDSAATATAMVAGVKTPARTLGVTQKARFGDCASQDAGGTDSIFALAEDAGMATGIVSTARITHATPASTYAMSVSRDWEDDTKAKSECKDIAAQLIDWDRGDGFEVVLGGGRGPFMTLDQQDPEFADKTGKRRDGRDLVAEWAAKSDAHTFVFDSAGFAAADFASDARVLGLFQPSHMQYELDRKDDPAGEPSLADLTRAAITRLQQDKDGFVLMVEGGRVDHAHHAGNAARALGDALAFDDAIAAALDMTSDEDTLVIVTADHSHTMTIAGYSRRGNPILGLSSMGIEPNKAADGKPYTTLGYANGPGASCPNGATVCSRSDLSGSDVENKDFIQQSRVPMGSETHAGEDVAIFASGPGAILVSGVIEQNEIFHVMGRSLGLID